MSKITTDDLRKVAKLARLELPPEDLETYAEQIEKILEYVAQIESIDAADIPPTSRAVEVINVTREDCVDPTPIREELLGQAPEREGNFFRVPRILSE